MWMRNHNCCQCAHSDRCTTKKLNLINASICGCLFTIGWWCFIDAFCVHPKEYTQHGWFILPGLGATAAFVIVNMIAKLPAMHVNAVYMTRTSLWCLRFLLFIGFFLSFSMIFTAVLMFMLQWAVVQPQPEAGWSYGFAIPQTTFIAAATFLFYFGVNIDEAF